VYLDPRYSGPVLSDSAVKQKGVSQILMDLVMTL
jgi:hypothetical protein